MGDIVSLLRKGFDDQSNIFAAVTVAQSSSVSELTYKPAAVQFPQCKYSSGERKIIMMSSEDCGLFNVEMDRHGKSSLFGLVEFICLKETGVG